MRPCLKTTTQKLKKEKRNKEYETLFLYVIKEQSFAPKGHTTYIHSILSKVLINLMFS
jgi:hypothetical protein